MALTVPVIGQLRELVTLQQEGTPAADGGGGYTQTWTAVQADIPARVEPAQAREELLGQKLASVASHAVTIRYMDGVVAGMRLLHGSVELNIRGVLDLDARGKFLLLACEEGVAT